MRIENVVNTTLRKEQAGFRRGRGTTEHIFTSRSILEQCNEWQRNIYINFVDFEKAFDSVHVTCCMQNSSLSFAVNSGVCQGCVMSAFLFIVIIDWLTRNVTQQQRTGIRWTLCTKLEDLEFADDIALPSHTRAHMQQKVVRLNDIANTIGLKINAGKTKVMSNDPNKEPISINNQALEFVDKFTYLGSIVNLHGGTEEDINSRLGKARAGFAHMRPIWKSST